jgi:Kef-type K+ transport system membrane component KefB
MDVETELQALLVVSVVSVAAPFVSAFLARLLVPQVVVLIAGGVLIGPQVGGLAQPESVELVANVGLGFLFLLAGYELDLKLFQERPGRLAITAWLVTVALAAALVGVWPRPGWCGRSCPWPWR